MNSFLLLILSTIVHFFARMLSFLSRWYHRATLLGSISTDSFARCEWPKWFIFDASQYMEFWLHASQAFSKISSASSQLEEISRTIRLSAAMARLHCPVFDYMSKQQHDLANFIPPRHSDYWKFVQLVFRWYMVRRNPVYSIPPCILSASSRFICITIIMENQVSAKAGSVKSTTPSRTWRGWLWDSADVSKEERRFLLKVGLTTSGEISESHLN